MKRLVQLLALLLVPVVIVATPNVAQAAPLGDWSTAVFDEPVGGPIPGKIKCQVNARWVEGTGGGTSIQVGPGSGCYSPGYYNSWQPGEPYTLSFQGSSCTGREFTATWMSGANHDWNSNHMVVGTSMEIPAGPCVPSSVCITGAGTDTTQLCGSISLGAAGPSGPTCPKGTLTGAFLAGSHWNPGASLSAYGWGSGFTSINNWRVYAIYNGTATKTVTNHQGTTAVANPNGTVSANGYLAQLFTQYTPSNLPPGMVGIGMYYNAVDIANKTNGATAWGDPTNGSVGRHEPGRCAFYYGTKVWDSPTTTADEPGGALGSNVVGPVDGPEPVSDPPAADEGDSCTFVWGDPSTWASAGICALVYLLDKVVNLLGSVVSAIGSVAGAILDGLVGLFVPSDGFMEAKANQLKDAWADTPPLVVVDGVQDLGDALTLAAPSSSCAGPALNISTEFTGPIALNPLSTCLEEVGVLASIVKTALTVVVYVGAFLAGVRIIGSAFGLDLSFGKEKEEA